MELVRDIGGTKTPFEKSKTFTRSILLQPKHLVPVFPLLGMLTIALGLAGITAARQLVISPTVIVDKKKRASQILPEIKDPEGTYQKGKQSAENSPFF